MTETEHAQWIKQFWLDKLDEIKGVDRMTDGFIVQNYIYSRPNGKFTFDELVSELKLSADVIQAELDELVHYGKVIKGFGYYQRMGCL